MPKSRGDPHMTVGYCYSVDYGSLPINPQYNCLALANFNVVALFWQVDLLI
ncbi:hypothetical protein MMK73_001230 [Providencia rettgeri]|uniref:hypothetical protein n=1 Tax=Providencia sp. TaxID=589 RepID=UPI0024AA164C|nr:hypothetical protein [Providencia rettgeri]